MIQLFTRMLAVAVVTTCQVVCACCERGDRVLVAATMMLRELSDECFMREQCGVEAIHSTLELSAVRATLQKGLGR